MGHVLHVGVSSLFSEQVKHCDSFPVHVLHLEEQAFDFINFIKF